MVLVGVGVRGRRPSRGVAVVVWRVEIEAIGRTNKLE